MTSRPPYRTVADECRERTCMNRITTGVPCPGTVCARLMPPSEPVPTVTAELVDRIQFAVRQIDGAMEDTRVGEVAELWLRRIRETLIGDDADYEPVGSAPGGQS